MGLRGQCAARGRRDPARAWLVCAACTLIHFLAMGFSYTAGVYFVVFLEVFGKDSSRTAVITSLNYGLLCFMGPVASLVLQRFGFRAAMMVGGVLSGAGLIVSAVASSMWVLALGFGFITGIGYGMTFTTGIVAVSLHFTYHRSLAIAVSLSGAGLGAILHPFLSELLMDWYGWRGALLLMAGITFNICLCAMFIPPVSDHNNVRSKISETASPEDKVGGGQQETCPLGLHLFKRPGFLLTAVHALLFCFAMNIMFTHVSAYGVWVGLSRWHAASLISTLGLAALMGRLAFGVLGQVFSVHPALILGSAYMLGGLGLGLVGLVTSYPTLLGITCVVGVCFGAYGSPLTDTVLYVTGRRHFHMGYGWNGLLQGIGSLLGGPSAGLVFDLSGYYPGSFLLGGAAMFVSGVVVLGVRWTPGGDKLEGDDLPQVSVKEQEEKEEKEDCHTSSTA